MLSQLEGGLVIEKLVQGEPQTVNSEQAENCGNCYFLQGTICQLPYHAKRDVQDTLGDFIGIISNKREHIPERITAGGQRILNCPKELIKGHF